MEGLIKFVRVSSFNENEYHGSFAERLQILMQTACRSRPDQLKAMLKLPIGSTFDHPGIPGQDPCISNVNVYLWEI